MRISDWSSDVCSSDLQRFFVEIDPSCPNKLARRGAPDGVFVLLRDRLIGMVHEAPCEGNGVAAGATGRSDRATDDGIPCHLAPFDRGVTHRFSPSAHVDAARNPPRPTFRPHRASQAGLLSSTLYSKTRHSLSPCPLT